MKVNISRAIKSISERIDFYQPLYESIVNSFQADASKIEIIFNTSDDNNYILGYSIKDNGIGYTTRNIDSFLEFWSDYKIEKFALGSGRILCLKVFDNMIIESQTKDTEGSLGKKIEINFNRTFSANSIADVDSNNFQEIKRFDSSSPISYTITKFENINRDFLLDSGNKYQEISIEMIKENIFLRLLPMFINFEEEEKDFEIYINDELWLNKENLSNVFTTLEFQNKSFVITKDLSIYDESLGSVEYVFNLKYRIRQDGKHILEQFYGAADRYICPFPKKVAYSKLEEGYSGIFCLTSDYFNSRVKDSRNAFVITMNQSNASLQNPITFPEINHQLESMLNEILRENFENIDDALQEKKNNIVKSFPHLARYVDKIHNLTISEHEILKRAEEEFRDEAKSVREEVINFTTKLKDGREKFDEEAYKKITQHFTLVGQEQLADYIGYRQTIIDMLLEIYQETQEDAARFNEKDIHDLFMPMSRTSNTSFKYANNIWIFDDKFMSYNYAASDRTIGRILQDIQNLDREEVDPNAVDKEPDLVMFYSNPNGEYKDVLLIEFKRLNDGIDSKEKAISQINRYPMYIKDHVENIRTIFTYTILDIDDEFRRALTFAHGFTENAFGTEDNKICAYYRYNQVLNAHTNVVSFSQVLSDANKRNKVFLDILIQNFNRP